MAEQRRRLSFYWQVLGMGTVLVGLGMLAWVVYCKFQDSRLRSQDGQFPLQKHKDKNGDTHIVDPNSAIASHFTFTKNGVEYPDPYDPYLQLEMSEIASRNRALTTAFPHIQNANQAKAASGYYGRKSGNGSNGGNGGGGKAPRNPQYDFVVEESAPVFLEEPKPRILDIHEALNQSTASSWILGQNQETGELATFDTAMSAHAAIVGGSGGGKTTSTGYMVLINALKSGHHVIVLDGKENWDFRRFSKNIEYWKSNYEILPKQIQCLVEMYLERKAIIDENNVSHVDDLPKDFGIFHVTVIIEEFGKMYRDLLDREGESEKLKDVVSNMIDLFCLSRMAGMHIFLIDQSPQKWPSQLKGNCGESFCYKLKGNGGHAVNEYKVSGLGKGVFSSDNKYYKAWWVKPEIENNTIHIPKSPYGKILPQYISQTVSQSPAPEPVRTSSQGGYNHPRTGSEPVRTSSEPVPVVQSEPPVASRLSGPATTPTEAQMIYNVYCQLDRKTNKTIEAIWGPRNGKRSRWFRDAIAMAQGASA